MALGLQGAMVVEIFPLAHEGDVDELRLQHHARAGRRHRARSSSTWLIDTLGHPLAPAYYIMLYGVIGLALMWPMAETNGRRLDG